MAGNIITMKLKGCMLALALTSGACSAATAEKGFEITPWIGYSMSSELVDATGGDLSVDNGPSLGFSVAWYDSPNGQGQVLLSRVSHQFDYGDNLTQDLDITYGHFNGIAFFHQEHYITTVSLGIGFAQFDAQYDDDIFPSAGVAVGTRHQFSDKLAFVTELRGNFSLVDEDSGIFCQNDVCSAEFSEALWLDTSFSVGLSYQF